MADPKDDVTPTPVPRGVTAEDLIDMFVDLRTRVENLEAKIGTS